jgi:spermidine/putrescine transport system ATP-binding protein
MQLELKSIQQEVGITFIYVTHDQEEAMTMSDRLAVMRHGRIDQIGGPEDVYEHPATPFVASFLGASNLLKGEMKSSSNGTTSILTEGGSVVQANSAMIPPDLDGSVQIGVRPEKITIVPQDDNPPPDRNHVSGVIRMSTYIGVNYQYEVEGPGGQMLRVYVQNLGAAGTHPNAGERVRLEWLPEHTFVVERSESEPEEGE